MKIPAGRLPTNEEVEFESVLGSRELLGAFLVVSILLGAFFAMGYIVGMNSTPVAAADVNPTRKTETKPLVVESPAPRPAEPALPESASPAPPVTPKQQPAESPTPPLSETAKFEPVEAVRAEKAEREEAAKSPPASGGAPSGTYLQLAARTKDEADSMVDALRQKKFAVITAAIPEKPGLFRVLVGPLAEAQVDKTKNDLQSAGFSADKSFKRNF